jgi:hypothetical protein
MVIIAQTQAVLLENSLGGLHMHPSGLFGDKVRKQQFTTNGF